MRIPIDRSEFHVMSVLAEAQPRRGRHGYGIFTSLTYAGVSIKLVDVYKAIQRLHAKHLLEHERCITKSLAGGPRKCYRLNVDGETAFRLAAAEVINEASSLLASAQRGLSAL